jgi:hypothetical protein
MPPAPEKKLTAAQVKLLRDWVTQGMKEGVDCLGPCDTLNITYQGTVLPLLQDNCIGCHNSSVPLLLTYNDVKVQVNNGKLLCAINHGSGCKPMPKNAAMLSPCKIKQITKWIASGALNN